MKTAIWKDGTKTVRETHTRDYKFAYRFKFTENGSWQIGFSTTRKAVESALRTATNCVISKPRGNDFKANRWYDDYIKSDDYKRGVEMRDYARSISEIVEVS